MDDLTAYVNEAYDLAVNQTTDLTEANNAVKQIYSQISSCYYQKCAKVTPPPISELCTCSN